MFSWKSLVRVKYVSWSFQGGSGLGATEVREKGRPADPSLLFSLKVWLYQS